MEKKELDDQLMRHPYVSEYDGSNKDALVYLPRRYSCDPDKKWPVILFLHGNGERGNGKDELDFVLIHGPLYEAWIQKSDLPFIIIAPQLDMFGKDKENDYLRERNINSIPKRLENGTPKRLDTSIPNIQMEVNLSNKNLEYIIPDRGWEKRIDDVIMILKDVIHKYNVDTSRIYLTGLSYGGFGTWYIASKHPELFAAAAPIAGWGHPDLMQSIAEHKLPIWTFAGGRDETIRKEYFFKGMNKLEELGHTNVRFTIHEDMGHDVWKRVYTFIPSSPSSLSCFPSVRFSAR